MCQYHAVSLNPLDSLIIPFASTCAMTHSICGVRHTKAEISPRPLLGLVSLTFEVLQIQ